MNIVSYKKDNYYLLLFLFILHVYFDYAYKMMELPVISDNVQILSQHDSRIRNCAIITPVQKKAKRVSSNG